MNIYPNKMGVNKQQGATLFTSLVFLVIITLIAVTAAKVSLVDVLVAGNNQQKMSIFQEVSNDSKTFTVPANLISTLINNTDFNGRTWDITFPTDPSRPNTEETIVSRNIAYRDGCGSFDGLAASQGADFKCFLYDFNVSSSRPSTNISELHVRGVGKEFPSGAQREQVLLPVPTP